ncbi:MAG: sodium-independent anion transporter [Flavobacterium sp.]|nr:MAG: sodium-independent anion transporter [Flavobacterium sp.]
MKNLFDFKHFKGDLFGGITAGIVALPLALAFGVSSGLGPSAGLYGAIFVGFFAALFGGTNTQISGPTAPMTAVAMVMIAGIVASFDGDVSKALPAILTVFLLAGLFQIVLGLLGIGKYIKYIPYPVVSGFMTAIGVIILVTQILPSVGYYPKKDSEFVNKFKPHAEEIILNNILKEEAGEGLLVLENFEETSKRGRGISQEQILKESKTLASAEASGVIGALKLMPRALQNINWLELLLALGTIFIIYGFKRITTKVPSTLVALVVMTSISIGFRLSYIPIEEIPSGIPLPNFKIFSEFSLTSITPYVFTALTLALLGAIDSLLTSVVADNMTKTKHNPNKELVGQGLGNSIAAIFGGLPGAGATIRTVVNINAGGLTRLSGMVAGVFLLVILLALGPIASQIPAAVLAGILITVGIGVMDYKGLKAIPYMPKPEVIIMIVVLVLSSVWNLVYAVGIGLVIASLMFMKKMGDLTAQRSDVKSLKEEMAWSDEADFPSELKNEVFIKHIKGPLFFGSTSDFQQLIKEIPETASTIIIRMGRMQYMDQSGLYAMEEILIDLVNEGKKVLLVNILEQPRYMLERIDIIPDLIPEENIFENFNESVLWVNEHIVEVPNISKKPPTKESQSTLTPREAHDILVEGNKRFAQNIKTQRNLKDQVLQTSQGQYPFAAVLSCIDSRVPVEMVFDLGIGDVFSVRVAGNVVNKDVLGSMEYACKVSGSKIAMVLGHTKCGAVTAACNNVELGNITSLLHKIKPAVEDIKSGNNLECSEIIEDIARRNVKNSIERIRKESPILAEMEKNNEIEIVGAIYDVTTGLVEFC